MARVAQARQLLVVLGCILDPDDVEAVGDANQQSAPTRKVLLTRRREPLQRELHLMWELPGGKVDFGESAEQAVVREVKEETGYVVDPIGLIPFTCTTEWTYENVRQQTIILCHRCKVRERPKNLLPTDHKVEEIRWIAFDEIDPRTVLGASRDFIWHVAKEQGIHLQALASKIAYAAFINLRPGKRRGRVYSIVLQINPEAERPYILTIRTGSRLSSRGQGLTIQAFPNDKAVRDKILHYLRRRREHGYAVSGYSDNFPFADRLEDFPQAQSIEDKQLPLL